MRKPRATSKPRTYFKQVPVAVIIRKTKPDKPAPASATGRLPVRVL